MTGMWLVSYVILWALALAGAVALLAVARELVALQRELQMVKYQLAHERERAGRAGASGRMEVR
jgi:hypothetical protein